VENPLQSVENSEWFVETVWNMWGKAKTMLRIENNGKINNLMMATLLK
jgi:hypothetical protein